MKNTRLIYYLLLLCIVFASQKLSSQPDKIQYNDLDNAYKEEIILENKALAERIKKFSQDAIAINTKIAQTLREKNYKLAFKYALKLDSIYPNNADIKNFEGKMQANLLDTTVSLKLFDEAIKLNPNNKWFYINKATVLADQNKKQEAIKTIEVLNKLFPNWSIGYNVKAALFSDLGSIRQALKAYKKAIECEPKSAQICTNRGDFYLLQNNQKQAITDYENALKIQPNYTRAQEKLKIVLK